VIALKVESLFLKRHVPILNSGFNKQANFDNAIVIEYCIN